MIDGFYYNYRNNSFVPQSLCKIFYSRCWSVLSASCIKVGHIGIGGHLEILRLSIIFHIDWTPLEIISEIYTNYIDDAFAKDSVWRESSFKSNIHIRDISIEWPF